MSIALYYAGDVRSTILGQIMGPDDLGRYLKATSAEFDGSRTRVEFASVELDTDVVFDGFRQLRAASSS